MSEWLQTYNEMFGMYHAGIITTIFRSFCRDIYRIDELAQAGEGLWSDRRIHGSRPYHRNVLAG